MSPPPSSKGDSSSDLRRSKRNKFHLDVTTMLYMNPERIQQKRANAQSASPSPNLSSAGPPALSPQIIVIPKVERRGRKRKSAVVTSSPIEEVEEDDEDNEIDDRCIEDNDSEYKGSKTINKKSRLSIIPSLRKRPHKCKKCPATFDSIISLSSHESLHLSGSAKYECTRCDYSSNSLSAIKSHREMHDKWFEEYGNNEDEDEDEPLLKTSSNNIKSAKSTPTKGNRTKKTSSTLSIHQSTSTTSKEEPIDKVVQNESNDKVEEKPKEVSKSESKKTQSNGRYKCTVCPYTTRDNERLIAHNNAHNKNSGYRCPLCTFKSPLVGLIKKHISLHGVKEVDWPPVYEGPSSPQIKKDSIDNINEDGNNEDEHPPTLVPVGKYLKARISSQGSIHSTISSIIPTIHPIIPPPILQLPQFLPTPTVSSSTVSSSTVSMTSLDTVIDCVATGVPPLLSIIPPSYEPSSSSSSSLLSLSLPLSSSLPLISLVVHPTRKEEIPIKMRSIRIQMKERLNKCRLCSFTTRYQATFLSHYIKNHPNKMKKMTNGSLCSLCGVVVNGGMMGLKIHIYKEHDGRRFSRKTIRKYLLERYGKKIVKKVKEEVIDVKKEEMEDSKSSDDGYAPILSQEKYQPSPSPSIKNNKWNKLINSKGDKRVNSTSPPILDRVEVSSEDDDDMPTLAPLPILEPMTQSITPSIPIKKNKYQRFVTSTGEKYVKCDVCPYLTRHMGDLRAHMPMHNKDGDDTRFRCHRCSYSTKKTRSLRDHTNWHHKFDTKSGEYEEIGSASSCNASISDRDSISRESSSSTKEEEVISKIRERTIRLRHIGPIGKKMFGGHESRRYMCMQCPFTTQYISQLHYHSRRHPSLSSLSSIHPSSSSSIMKCRECTYSTSILSNLSSHMSMHTIAAKTFPCQFCTFVGRNDSSLRDHMITHGSIPSPHSSTPSSSSHQSTPSNDISIIQIRGLNGEKPTTFNLSASRKLMRPSKEEKKLLRMTNKSKDKTELKCKECPFSDPDQLIFDLHIAMHKGPKRPFECNVCTYSVYTAEGLHRHISLHILPDMAPLKRGRRRQSIEVIPQGTPSFDCSSCSFRTIDQSLFHLHRLEHAQSIQQRLVTQIKRAAASEDDKIIRKKNTKPSSKNARQMGCDKCGFCCDTGVAMIKHRELHDSNLPYKCTICNYACSSKQTVDFHLFHHHTNFPLAFLINQAKLMPDTTKIKIDTSMDEKVRIAGQVFSCELCSKQLLDIQSFLSHYENDHNLRGDDTACHLSLGMLPSNRILTKA